MLQKSPFNFGFKSLALLALFAVISCSGNDQNNQSGIRIVDLNGKPQSVRRFVPEGNAQMLANQQSDNLNSGNIPPINNNIAPINNNIAPTNNIAPANNNFTQNTNQAPNNNFNNLPPIEPPAPIAENQPEAVVSYDLSNDKVSDENATKEVVAVKPEAIKTQNTPKNSSGKKFTLVTGSSGAASTTSSQSSPNKSKNFVQIGSFSVEDNANKILQKNKKISEGVVEEAGLGDKKIYRVLLGPAPSKKKTIYILKQAKNAGYQDAFIVK
jgi:cell division septation protein DedD